MSGTLEVVRWSSDQVSDMKFPCGCCVEEGGNHVVSTLSKFCWVNLVLLITVLLPTHPYQRPRVFPPCDLYLFEISMCPGLFLVNSLILCL